MRAFGAIGVAFLACVIYLLVDWLRERRRLRAYVRSLPPMPLDPWDRVLALAARLGNEHRAYEDPVYLCPIFRSFGATASALMENGGCCSGLSRLYMLALEAQGVRANQVTVYHQEGYAQHCLVEVHLAEGSACVDPVYGIYYGDEAGRPLGLEGLQGGARVRCHAIPGARNPGYPADPYYDFDYALTRTANWTRSWPRRTAYALLRLLSNGGVDRMRVPQLLEWPQTLLALLLTGLAAAGSAVLALSRSLPAF
ncbi:MAG: hypothetical protein P8188_09795 [Gemmatimonadota bacterium]